MRTLSFALCGMMLALAACGDDSISPEVGTLDISVVTSGEDLDADGFTLVLDGVPGSGVASGEVVAIELEPGIHTVELTGVADNCEVEGENPREITVELDAAVDVAFSVVCTAIA